MLRVAVSCATLLSDVVGNFITIFIGKQITRQDPGVLVESIAHLHVPDDGGDEHDDHDDQGTESNKAISCASNGEQTDQTDLANVETGDQLLQGSSIAVTFGVDCSPERKENIVAEAEVHETEADGSKTKDQRSDNRVRECCDMLAIIFLL